MPPKKRKQRGCDVTGCDGKHLAIGLCRKHYSEQRRRDSGVPGRGDPKPWLLEFMVPTELYERFQDLVPRGQRSDVLRKALEHHLERLEAERRA